VTLPTWDPELYRRYDDHRGRPFLDLIARIGAEAPREVVDLGCGPGHLTSLLAGRWPSARVLASDGYPEMVEAARANGVDATLLDVRDFVPGPETDVVVTNAVLHWVPEHRSLMARWVADMPPGAWLAVQVPGNGPAPSHVLIRELLAEEPWASRVSSTAAAEIDFDVAPPAEYAQLVASARPGAVVDAWETTYVHPLTGDDPVLDWVSGTTLRPVRSELSDADWAEFRTELGERLRLAYPADDAGTTWFGFRRVFCVVRCP
jgi:trans-aconitate 2-methyltransferase